MTAHVENAIINAVRPTGTIAGIEKSGIYRGPSFAATVLAKAAELDLCRRLLVKWEVAKSDPTRIQVNLFDVIPIQSVGQINNC